MAVRVSKAEWMANRLANEQARGDYVPVPKMGPRGPNPFGEHGSLSRDAMDQQAVKERLRELAGKAPKGATIHAKQPSECFVSLSWKDGIATAEFYRGGAIVYDYEMDKDEFLDWALSDSLGGFFNDVIR